MVKAVVCPICNGKGTLVDYNYYTTASTNEKICHGCNGKGWVEVGD